MDRIVRKMKNTVEFEGMEISNLQAKKLEKIADLRKPFQNIDDAYDNEICFDLKDNTFVFMTVRGRIYTYDVATDTNTTINL